MKDTRAKNVINKLWQLKNHLHALTVTQLELNTVPPIMEFCNVFVIQVPPNLFYLAFLMCLLYYDLKSKIVKEFHLGYTRKILSLILKIEPKDNSLSILHVSVSVSAHNIISYCYWYQRGYNGVADLLVADLLVLASKPFIKLNPAETDPSVINKSYNKFFYYYLYRQ